jgi:hypothetical protein
MILSQLIALSVEIHCFLNISHFIINTSNMGIGVSTFIIYLDASFKTLECIFVVSFILIYAG